MPKKIPDACLCFSKVKLKARLLYNVTQNIAEKQVGLFIGPDGHKLVEVKLSIFSCPSV